MKELAIYALETLACGGVLLAAYALLLERRTRFGWCRAYLLSATVLMALIPLLRIPVWPGKIIEAVPLVTVADWDTAAVVIEPEAAPAVAPEVILAAFYLLGTGLILGSMLWQALRIRNLRRDAQIIRTSRFKLVRTRQKVASFSFFRTIYIWQGTPDEEFPAILAHEQSHIAHHHSIERIVMECLKALLWWNPFVWIAARRLTQAEEFEADSDVLSSGYDIENYMSTLFKQLFGYSPDIANGLRDSLTKKRFQMMTTSTPRRHGLLRLAGTLPALIGLLCAFSFTSRAAVVRVPDSAGEQPEEFFKRVILLNGKPASIDEVYRLDPASIDTIYRIDGKSIDGQRPDVDYTFHINTKGTPRQSKLTTLTGRVHYPDGKPATNFDVYAGIRQPFVLPANQAEMDRLGTKTDAQGYYKLQAPVTGIVSAHNFHFVSSSTYNSKGAKTFTHDIKVEYPDSARWQKKVEADGSITLLPQRVPDTEYQDKYTVVAKMVKVHLIINLRNSDGSYAKMPPANGAIVRIIGTDKGIVTDKEGKATIEAPAGSVLEIMHIGYEPLAVSVPDQEHARTIILQPEGSLKPQQTPIYVRDQDGVKQRPLYIVNGVEIANLEDVDASQVESISVFKDQKATALYGERGKNGVVVITFKSMAKLQQQEKEAAVQKTKAATAPATSSTSEQSKDNTPFLVTETMPKFQGGTLMEFRKWVSEQVKYPTEAMSRKIQGRVVLQFIIESDGTVNKDEIMILQSPDKLLSDEARRVIASSPAWTPGEQKGQKVRVKYTLPLDFRVMTDKGSIGGSEKEKPSASASTVEEISITAFGK